MEIKLLGPYASSSDLRRTLFHSGPEGGSLLFYPLNAPPPLFCITCGVSPWAARLPIY